MTKHIHLYRAKLENQIVKMQKCNLYTRNIDIYWQYFLGLMAAAGTVLLCISTIAFLSFIQLSRQIR